MPVGAGHNEVGPIVGGRGGQLVRYRPVGIEYGLDADLDAVAAKVGLDVGKVRLGQEVAVSTDIHPQKRYKGRISFISSKAEFTPKSVETHAERVTLVYRIKIDIDNPTHELVPGMPADARIEVREPGT